MNELYWRGTLRGSVGRAIAETEMEMEMEMESARMLGSGSRWLTNVKLYWRRG